MVRGAPVGPWRLDTNNHQVIENQRADGSKVEL